ncbi:hypothetical protein LJB42_003876 [Komagataella kurtzmanii]|nr:hypothetical protein LJB42_003876 [Komagataella kurtzmanii]
MAPIVDRTTRTIGGVKVYLYGLGQLPSPDISSPPSVAVCYLFHGRGQNKEYIEKIGLRILEIYSSNCNGRSLPLIMVNFDMRNHGERLIETERNHEWKQGNITHAIDMISNIDGSVDDACLISNMLPGLYPGYVFRNLALGISMGGHACYRMAVRIPDNIECIIPIIGCPDVSSLLLNRLKESRELTLNFRRLSYEDLKLNSGDSEKWPESFHNYVTKQDYQISENFPNHVKVLALCGELDKLVPKEYTEEWVEEMENARAGGDSVTLYIDKEAGHQTTDKMVKVIGQWLSDFLRVY